MMKSFLRSQFVWFGALPATIAAWYWFSLRSFAFTDGTRFRIPALPKVFFDQTMYMQVLAKDVIHGFHILSPLLRPFEALAVWAWPAVTLSELYVVGIILSAAASLWMLAVLIHRLTGMPVAQARLTALGGFLLVQGTLVLRPGAPSWYVPFFLVALLCAWHGERMWADRRMVAACVLWIAAIVLSSVYPWYFASILATVGLLFLLRFARPRHVLPGIAIGFTATGIAYALRGPIVDAITSSYAVLLAYHGGVQWSRLTTVSNTILLLGAWFTLWLLVAVRRSRQEDPRAPLARFFLVAWTGQTILWFQSLFTNLSIVPDHFIYTVWLLSLLSWGVSFGDDEPSSRERKLRLVVGAIAAVYVCSIIVRMVLGLFVWTTFPSLLIHLGAWTFLAFAALPVPRRMGARAMLVLGICSVVVGFAAVRTSALARMAEDREMDGVRAWLMSSHPSPTFRSCSDARAAEYLFATTGQDVYPTYGEKHDPVTIEKLQNRLVEIAGFFSPRLSGDLYLWDDAMLHDLDFPCRAFQPGIRAMEALPLSRETKIAVTGCNQTWVDSERARVTARVDARWAEPLPASSALCDRFIVRERLRHAWRIPSSYRVLYTDAHAAVYGRE